MIAGASLSALLILSLTLSGLAFQYTNCGSELGEFLLIRISSCEPPNGPFCELKRGTNASISIVFKSNSEINHVKAVVHGILGGVPIPFNLPNPDGCKLSNLTCPLQGGIDYTYTAHLPVLQSYPKVRVSIEWELRNEQNKDIICFKLPAKIV